MDKWVNDNKGSGPWAFDEQTIKMGYLNNPNWASDGILTRHSPCGHWHKYPLVSYGFRYPGEFTGIIDSYEYDTAFSLYNIMVHVTGNIYAILYYNQTSLDALVLKTIEIDSAGNITTPSIDTWSIFACPPWNNPGGIIRVNEATGMFAVYWSESTLGGGDSKVHLGTFSINSDGTINKTILYEKIMGGTNSLVGFRSALNRPRSNFNIFVVTYRDSDGLGKMASFSISSAGVISNVIDTVSFSPYHYSSNLYTKAFKETGIMCATSWGNFGSGSSPDRYQSNLYTVLCSTGGQLSNIGSVNMWSHVSSYDHQYSYEILDIEEFNGIAVFHANYTAGNVLKLKTYSISSVIAPVLVDSNDSFLSYGVHPCATWCTEDGYVISVRGTPAGVDDFNVIAVNFGTDGTIGEITDSQVIDVGLSAGDYSSLVRLSSRLYAVAYKGVSVDGFVVTFGMDHIKTRYAEAEASMDEIDDEPVVWPMD